MVMISLEKCPKHKEEFLSIKNLIIKYPDCPDGIATPFFNYCKKDNKYYNGKEFVSAEEIALEFINYYYHKNYKLSDIEVTALEDLVKEKTRTKSTSS